MLSSLRYALSCLRYPQARSIGLLRQSMGVEKRHQKFGTAWAAHLARCKHTQAQWQQSLHENSRVLILGAGRLLDINLETFSSHPIVLVDGDPLCASEWKRKLPELKGRVEHRLLEFSGALPVWSQHLSSQSAGLPGSRMERWQICLRHLENIHRECPPKPVLSKLLSNTNAVLAANYLSQLVAHWQDLVEGILNNHFGAAWVSKREAEWLNSIQASTHALLASHLVDVLKLEASSLLLITDREYADYRYVSSSSSVSEPLTWDGAWKANPTIRTSKDDKLTTEVIDALQGAWPDDFGLPQELFDSYELTHSEHWPWQIVPLGGERKEEGTVHLVGAYHLQQRSG